MNRFTAFVSGSFCIVLAALSFVDEDILLKLELVPGHSVIWFLGVFSAIFALSRSFIPAETLVFQPEKLMREIIEKTHYCPPVWHDRLHSDLVRRQFGRLFQYKIVTFLTEIFGVLFVPFILLFSLPSSAQEIVDFIIKFSIQKKKIGTVCSFAVFDLKRHGNPLVSQTLSHNNNNNK